MESIIIMDNSNLTEKPDDWIHDDDIALQAVNPVVETTEFAYRKTNIVQVNDEAVKTVAYQIYQRFLSESYTPRIWHTHPLHICPPEPYDPSNPLTTATLNWIFFISSLNFSFWSSRGPDRFAVEWRAGWDQDTRTVWTGYWSLVAAINRALEDDIPIIDPSFYASETLCPDSLLEHVFRCSSPGGEEMPLLKERIAILREVGFILCARFNGSFQGFIEEFHRQHDRQGTTIDLVKMVTDTFPSFRDEIWFEGRRIFFWKRAQILVAETWAAFYPSVQPLSQLGSHPIFPGTLGPSIEQLTMFADYRVPQILHHMRILTYPPTLVRMLCQGTPLEHGSREEVSIRSASIVAVERIREEMLRIVNENGDEGKLHINSALIDFYLWDSAKCLEDGEELTLGVDTDDIVPMHRTRSIWY